MLLALLLSAQATTLEVKSAGDPLLVFVDGKEKGRTPLTLDLPEGTWQLTGKPEPWIAAEVVVELDITDQVQGRVELDWDNDRHTLDWEWAEVEVVTCLGGDDSYLIPAGATAALDHPVSVLIDLGGNDNYGYIPVLPAPHALALPEDDHGRWEPVGTPGEINGPVSLSDHNRQGSGRLGAGMLFDLGDGADEYSSLRLSQGSGVYGLGLLYDDGGDDGYKAEAIAQGAGIFGIGLLIDEAGDDDYQGFHGVQAFASK